MYRKIDTRIWYDEKFRVLSKDAKYFFLYLLTSPHSTGWGAYVIHDSYIQGDLEFSAEVIKGLWHEVIRAGLVKRDKKTNLIVFPNWVKYNKPNNPTTRNAWKNGLAALPKSTLLTEYIESLQDVLCMVISRNDRDGFAKASRRDNEGFAMESQNVRDEIVSEQKQEQIQKQDQVQVQKKEKIKEKKSDRSASGSARASYAAHVDDIFSYWCRVMGKDEKRAKCPSTSKRYKRIVARLKDGYTVEDLKKAIDGCKASAFHMGENENNKQYNDLELICRDVEHLEQFIEMAESNDESSQEKPKRKSMLLLAGEIHNQVLGKPWEKVGDLTAWMEKIIEKGKLDDMIEKFVPDEYKKSFREFWRNWK